MAEPVITIRASSFATLFDCPARWEAIHIAGKCMPATPAAVIGSAIHAGAAIYDQARLDGDDAQPDDALDAAADYVRNPTDEVNWDGSTPAQAIDIAARVTLSYCLEISPTFTWTKVESKCKELDIEASNGLVIRFTGHIDRQQVKQNALGICDLKSGQRIIGADGKVKVQIHGAQLGQYELLELMEAHTSGVQCLLPAQVIALPTSGKYKPAIHEVRNPHRVLIGDGNQKGLIDYAAAMFKSGLFYGNPRSILCNPKYCPIYKSCFFRFTEE